MADQRIGKSVVLTDPSTSTQQAAVTSGGDLKVTLDGEGVVGNAAEDAAAVGNPVLVGGRYDSTARGLDTGDVGVPALSIAAETIAIPQCRYIQYGAERCEIKHANVITSTDAADLIAAVAGKKFVILALAIHATSITVTNVYLEDADGTDVWGTATGVLPISVDADGDNVAGLVLPFNPGGWFKTATANKDLHIKLSAAQIVVVTISYVEVT